MRGRGASARSRATRGLGWILVGAALLGPARLAPAQAPDRNTPGVVPPDLARAKEEEVRQKLEQLEETMDRLAGLLQSTEPQNAARLRIAFQEARSRLVREGLDRIIRLIEDRKLDRAIASQEEVKTNLEDILSILLESDIDPREILKHIRRLRDIAKDLDKVIEQETSEKMASDDAAQAESSSEALAGDIKKLEDLVRRERGLEDAARGMAGAEGKGHPDLAKEQEGVEGDTRALREGDDARGAEAQPQPGQPQPGQPQPGQPQPGQPQPGQPQPGQPQPGQPQPGQPQPGQPQPGQPPDVAPESAPEAPPSLPRPGEVLDKKSLAAAEAAMQEATEAFRSGKPTEASRWTAAARKALEEAGGSARDKLERLRADRNFPQMREDQDATKKTTDSLADRMKEAPPLVSTPEEGVPGRQEVEAASSQMGDASESLGRGEAPRSSRSQKKALDNLKQGREKTEEALEELQRQLRQRILAYLRERFTKMLNEQRAVTRETRSLDLKLRALAAARASAGAKEAPAEIDRKDRQGAETLSKRETGLIRVADDVADLLAEDGTTLVFPNIVVEIQADLGNVAGLLSTIETGPRTQHIQLEIEAAIEEILKALETAQKSPPPPNPSQGRQSKSGAGPLLPMSAELKMVRSLQKRVNERTSAFDLARQGKENLSPEDKLQLGAIQRKQDEVESMTRKLREAAQEQP